MIEQCDPGGDQFACWCGIRLDTYSVANLKRFRTLSLWIEAHGQTRDCPDAAGLLGDGAVKFDRGDATGS